MTKRPTKTIQTYECRLRKARVLRVSDVGGVERVSCADELARAAHAAMRDLPHEQVWLFFLNGKNAITGLLRAGEGGLHGCALRPIDVLRPVVLSGASAFALAHNHPSGDPAPSHSDWELTKAIRAAAEVVGLTLLDHLIVTQRPDVWFSMFQSGDWS